MSHTPDWNDEMDAGGDVPDGPTPAEQAARRLRREGLKGLALFCLVALPVAALCTLWLSDFFDTYAGTAVCHRPVAGSDGVGDQELRFVLLRADGDTIEVVLPTRAFKDSEIPQCLSGVPPARIPEGAPEVRKDLFKMDVSIGGRSVPTSTPIDIFLPIFLAFGVALPIRNWFVTNSPFRLAGHVEIPPMLQAAPGRPAPAKTRGSIGPPPQGGRKRRKRR